MNLRIDVGGQKINVTPGNLNRSESIKEIFADMHLYELDVEI